MKKTNFNFKDLKGSLSRNEMKAIKGGDVLRCNECNDDPALCMSKHCGSPQCWIHREEDRQWVCWCDGECR